MRKKTYTVCTKCGRKICLNSLTNHMKHCDGNPVPKKKRVKYPLNGRKIWNEGLTKDIEEVRENSRKSGDSQKGKKRKSLSKEHREKTSISMKKAHSEGRAWNIGMSRWNNEPSYPEVFFMRVIENEFDDKNYIKEYPFHKFSLDFAWIEKKKVIEIDGCQHDRFEDQKVRDEEKNDLLKKEGWELLRIKWVDIFNDTKHWIQIAKNFIH